jgi:hypothetical protein
MRARKWRIGKKTNICSSLKTRKNDQTGIYYIILAMNGNGWKCSSENIDFLEGFLSKTRRKIEKISYHLPCIEEN